jgi:hypothetical protein
MPIPVAQVVRAIPKNPGAMGWTTAERLIRFIAAEDDV